jgi:Right handed beta helix region
MFRRSFCVAVIAVAALTLPALANAQATRTWVSGVGDDANPCSRTAPCKTFAGAISKTISGGIISVLDPGGFGALTITKPITLTGPPGYGSILASGVQGIVINITSSNPGPVIIRNIDISGTGITFGTNGINFIAGRTLRLQNVNIESFSGVGVLIGAANAKVYSNNLLITQVARGIVSNGTSASATFRHLDITEGNNGIEAYTGNFNVEDCTITDEANNGLYAKTNVHVDTCDFHNNGNGVTADAGGLIRVQNSMITNNNTGVFAFNGGSVLSRGNNTLIDNAGGNSFSGSFGPQ